MAWRLAVVRLKTMWIFRMTRTRRIRNGVKTIPLPARSPDLNAFAERWVRSAKQCLSKLILFGEGPLVRTLAEFGAHYHKERNHQGKGNKLLFPDAANKTKPRGHT